MRIFWFKNPLFCSHLSCSRFRNRMQIVTIFRLLIFQFTDTRYSFTPIKKAPSLDSHSIEQIFAQDMYSQIVYTTPHSSDYTHINIVVLSVFRKLTEFSPIHEMKKLRK